MQIPTCTENTIPFSSPTLYFTNISRAFHVIKCHERTAQQLAFAKDASRTAYIKTNCLPVLLSVWSYWKRSLWFVDLCTLLIIHPTHFIAFTLHPVCLLVTTELYEFLACHVLSVENNCRITSHYLFYYYEAIAWYCLWLALPVELYMRPIGRKFFHYFALSPRRKLETTHTTADTVPGIIFLDSW